MGKQDINFKASQMGLIYLFIRPIYRLKIDCETGWRSRFKRTKPRCAKLDRLASYNHLNLLTYHHP